MKQVEQIIVADLTENHAINLRGHHQDGREVAVLLFDMVSVEGYKEGHICVTEQTAPESEDHTHPFTGLHKFRLPLDAVLQEGSFNLEVSQEPVGDEEVTAWQVMAGVSEKLQLIFWGKPLKGPFPWST